MKTRLILTAMALLAVEGRAADFSLANANIGEIDHSRWKCKRCEVGVSRSIGTVGVGAGGVDSSNDHIANRFGATDGGFVALNANVRQQNEGGSTQTYQASNLGMESGFGTARYQGYGIDAEVGYTKLYSVESDTATTPGRQPGDSFILTEEQRRITLDKERERADFSAGYDYRLFGLSLRTFGDYHYETIDGKDSSSLNYTDRRPVNYAEQLDYTHNRFNVGTDLRGSNWLASVSYLGSIFDNDQTGVYAEDGSSLKALVPENESHTILGQANYALGRTRFSARFAREWLEQDEHYVTGLGVPQGITHYNGDVDVMKGSARLASAFSDILRLSARYDYYDRENNSPEFSFDQTIINGGSGNPVENVTYDLTKHGVELDSHWRLLDRVRLDVGYFGEFIERDPSARKDTDENGLYGKVRVTPIPAHRLSLELRYSERDGSTYRDTNVGGGNNPRLRQYHLADRDRTRLEGNWLISLDSGWTLDMTAHYAKDDYDNQGIGLLDVKDYGYDVSTAYPLAKNIDLEFYGGQQWVESDQQGSQALDEPDWAYDIDDSYDYVGAGIRWGGLMQDKLALGADYLYSQSDSDTDVKPGEDYGDYYQWSHSTRLFADYTWSEKTSLRLDYRYERHRDFNFADVRDNDISGLTTLGILGDRYNAHLLMLSFTYSIQ